MVLGWGTRSEPGWKAGAQETALQPMSVDDRATLTMIGLTCLPGSYQVRTVGLVSRR